jgi:hypothetical protein
MLATLSLLLWLIGFYLVLKYRVHIHVNIETDGSYVRRRRHVSRGSARQSFVVGQEAGESPVPAEVSSDRASTQAEVAAALSALGCQKAKAKTIASRVCSQPGSFDELLRRAIREAA